MSWRPPSVVVLLVALQCLVSPLATVAAAPVAPESVIKCAECGMNANVENRFTARIVQGGNSLYFCDIGDLAAFIERTHPKEYAASVRDFRTGEWVAAGAAFFVIDKKVFSTPMGWGVAAFKDRAEATGVPLNFEALQKALR